jgi:hypothetical protein
MSKAPEKWLAVFWIAAVVFLLATFARQRRRSAGSHATAPTAVQMEATNGVAVKQEGPAAADEGTAAAGTPAVQPSTAPPAPTSADPDLAVFLSDDFRKTSTSERWRKSGVTDADLALAVGMMRDRGFSGAQLRDPSLVGQFLPARNIEPVYIESIELPGTAAPNRPVPFRVAANFPSPAFTFEEWDIRQEGSDVFVRPVGSRSAGPVAAVVVPANLEGSLPALPPGQYTVRFEAIGEPMEKMLTVQ